MLSIRYKLLLPIMSLVLIIFVVLLLNGYRQIQRTVNQQEMQHYLSIETNVTGSLEDTLKSARYGLLSMIEQPGVQRAFAARDREMLLQLTRPIYQKLKSEGVEQIQFLLPPATSFLRLHMPDKFGDDLSAIRHTVMECNQNKKMVEGLEEGRGGFGFRVVAPVFFQGEYVGCAEYGVGFGKADLEKWKKETGADFFVYGVTKGVSWVGDAGKNAPLAATAGRDTAKVDKTVVESVLKTGKMEIVYPDGGKTAAMIIPLRDYSGKTAAYIKAVLGREKVVQQIRLTMVKSLGILVAGIIIVGLVLYATIRRCLIPLEKIADGMEKAGRGDLTQKLPVSGNDEIGRLAGGFNGMVENIRGLVAEASRSADELSGSSRQLSASTQQVSATVQKVAVIMDNLSADAGGLEGAARQMEDSARHVLDMAGDGEVSMTRLNRLISDLQLLISNISDVVHGFGNRSREIGNIVDVISDIAEQTNLLALNASIEAARAGEHGRGFAVVAAEVQTLAEKSKAATLEISRLISLVQQEASQAVAEVDKGTAGFMEGAGQLADTGGKFNKIIQAIDRQSRFIQSVVKSLILIKASTQEVATAMGEQSSSTENIASSALELSSLAGELNNNIARFRL